MTAADMGIGQASRGARTGMTTIQVMAIPAIGSRNSEGQIR